MTIVLYNLERNRIALWDACLGLVHYPNYLGWPHLEQAINYGWEVIGTL